MIASDVPMVVAMAITGHKTDAMFRRYAIVDQRQKRQALAKTAAYLNAKIGCIQGGCDEEGRGKIMMGPPMRTLCGQSVFHLNPHLLQAVKEMAPQVGLEPTTLRLTAVPSTSCMQ